MHEKCIVCDSTSSLFIDTFLMTNVKIYSLGYFKYVNSFKRLTAFTEGVLLSQMLLRVSQDRRPHFENAGIDQKMEFGGAGVAHCPSQRRWD